MKEEQKGSASEKGGFNKIARSDSSDEDENYEEPEDQRAIPSFLLNIPGVTSTDSMGYRIEALRVYLENNLGDIPFIAAYKHLVVRSTIALMITV